MNSNTSRQNRIGTRGYSSLNQKAPGQWLVLTVVTEAGVVMGGVGSFFKFFPDLLRFSPFLLLVIDAFCVVGIWALCRLLFQQSVGEWAWGLKAPPSKKIGFKLSRHCYRMGRWQGAVIILTILGFFNAVWIPKQIYQKHPLWKSADEIFLGSSVPDLSVGERWEAKAVEGEEKWIVIPYFYSLGAWPRTYRGNPVFYNLPYAKGPPTRFLERVTARWSGSEVQVVFEGPKTPAALLAEGINRSQVQHCLLHTSGFWGYSSQGVNCAFLRQTVLERHLHDLSQWMGSIPKEYFILQWFRVNNPGIPEAEQTQGFVIKALTESKAVIRYVLLTPNNTHQSVTLYILANQETINEFQYAEALLKKAIGTLRVSDDLAAGKNWADREIHVLAQENPARYKDSPDFLYKLAEIQMALLGKLSVSPADTEAYFHLANMTLQQIKSSKKFQKPEWAAGAKRLIRSVYDYTRDVISSASPKVQDELMARIEAIWLEAKQY